MCLALGGFPWPGNSALQELVPLSGKSMSYGGRFGLNLSEGRGEPWNTTLCDSIFIISKDGGATELSKLLFLFSRTKYNAWHIAQVP